MKHIAGLHWEDYTHKFLVRTFMYVIVGYTNWLIKTQPNIFLPLTFRSVPETFLRRSLFTSSSASCHDGDATWQEIGRMCGSVCNCPRPIHGTLSLFPNTYCFFDPSSIFVRFSVQNCSRWPIDHVVVVRLLTFRFLSLFSRRMSYIASTLNYSSKIR